MKNKYYNFIVGGRGYGKTNYELSQEIKALNNKIDKLYQYVYGIQKYLSEDIIKEINERYGDLLNED